MSPPERRDRVKRYRGQQIVAMEAASETQEFGGWALVAIPLRIEAPTEDDVFNRLNRVVQAIIDAEIPGVRPPVDEAQAREAFEHALRGLWDGEGS